MDYSKWRKILIILMIINLLWLFYNRVFASSTTSFDDAKNGNNFTLNNYTITLPSFIFDYDYIVITHCYNTWTIVFSNNQLAYQDKGNDPYYSNIGTYKYLTTNTTGNDTLFYKFTFTGKNIDKSSVTLSNATEIYTYNGDAWLSPDNPTTGNYTVYYSCNFNVYSQSGDLIYQGETYRNPSFDQSDEEIQTLDFTKLFINPYDYGIDNNLFLKILEVTNVIEDNNNPANNIYYYNDLTFKLNKNSEYLTEFFDTDTYYYSVPYSALKLKKDKSYYFILTSSQSQIEQTLGEITENETIFDVCLCDTANLITTQEEILNSIINNNPSQNTEDNINNNLPRPGYEDNNNNINIPGMNVNIPNDITENGFNTIFSTIYNALYIASNPQPR